jgi:hypothetical protein
MIKYPLHYIILYKISYTLQHIVPVAVDYSYRTPQDEYGNFPKHVE